jgi:putative membrane protein
MTNRHFAAVMVAFAMTATSIHAQGQRGTSTAVATNAETFINQMAVAGKAEVELGNLATQRAQNADVKAFGQMMVKDHTQANTELIRIAKQMNVAPPTQLDMKHRELVDRLSKLTGADFDREYMTAMVMGHEEVSAKLRTMSAETSTSTSTGRSGQSVGTTGSDAALKQWAGKTLPTVQQHLERAKQLEQKVK